ncbi:methyl-accepting chemotaxis protein [Bradyrhizobium sp.]|jgi:methyl-accepting chemotaxis protein|uniref:methyl-accepting chemotaxis protein n=1 Tax=Bradyrhizobium sp. TaxID=376 RepID=UPI003C6EA61A
MMRISIKRAIILFLSTMCLFLIGVVGKQYFALKDLSQIQDSGAAAAAEAISYTRASSLGAEIYQVIADAIINRQLDETAKEWSEAKAAALTSINDVASHVKDPKEADLVKEATESFSRIVAIFEQEMLPELKKSAGLTPAIEAMDGKLDEHLRVVARDFLALKAARIATATQGDQEFDAAIQATMKTVVGILLISLVFAGASAVYLVRKITIPLTRLNGAMTEMVAGDFAVAVPGVGRGDELGEMARTVEIFKKNGLEVERLKTEQQAGELRATQQRKAAMTKLADDFEGAVGKIVNAVSAASSELESSATTLTATAARAQQLTTKVAAASEAASANVQSVASASEQMSSSVNEISRQVQDSARIAAAAVQQARNTNDRVGELAKAADRIGDVVELINTIAGQTNLLALNATIEAARAGDAGRGFAVVASEVKALAEQTAKATGEISAQISGIQSATGLSVAAIKEIGDTIAKISEIAATIATTVEQQGAATQEISRNVQQASLGTTEVSANLTDVQRGANETGSASSQVLSAARSLSGESDRLKQEVGRFLNSVRAA